METKCLSQFVVDLRYDDLSVETKEMVKLCLIDWFGCCIRGSIEASSMIMRAVLNEEPSSAVVATNICDTPFRTSALDAALANGLYSHALDTDDVHSSSQTHLGVAVIPAALAIAEKVGASGKEVMTAIVAGYEVMARVAESVLPEGYYYWHLTGGAGAFGAAAAAGKLLKLNTQQMVYALGSAGTQSAGLFEFLIDGANSKTFHAGKAAYNGVLAALLSQKGFTAAERILEGEKGFCRAMTKNPKLEKIVDGLGKDYKINENSFKPYTCCRWVHGAINAALDLNAKYNFDLSQIKQIVIKASPTAIDVTANPDPKTVYGCKFSLEYTVAAALYCGRIGLDEFTSEKMFDQEIRRIMKLCKTATTNVLDANGKEMKEHTEVVIIMTDGKEYSLALQVAKGDPLNPMSFKDMEDKFRMLVGSVYGESQIKSILELARTFETVENFSTSFSFLSNR